MKLALKLTYTVFLLYGSPALCMQRFATLSGSDVQQEARVAPVRNVWINKYEVTTDEVKTNNVALSTSTEKVKQDNALSELIVYDTKKVGIQKLLYDLITTLPKELIEMIVSYYHLHIPEGKLVKTVSVDMRKYDFITHLSALSDDMLAVVTDDNDLHIVDCNEGVCVKTYKSENFKWFGPIRNIVEAGDGVIAFVSGQQLGLLDITTNKCVWYKVSFDEQHSHVELASACISPRGWLVVVLRHDDEKKACDTFAFFNLNTKKWDEPFMGKFLWGTQMAFLTPEHMAFAHSTKEGINFLDVKTGAKKRAQHSRNCFGGCHLRRLSNKLLAVTEWDFGEDIKIWDALTGSLVRAMATNCSRDLIVHPSNLLIVKTLRGDAVKLFDPVMGNTVGEFKIDGEQLTALSSGRLATVVKNEIKIWE